jgi:hypothetical protein
METVENGIRMLDVGVGNNTMASHNQLRHHHIDMASADEDDEDDDDDNFSGRAVAASGSGRHVSTVSVLAMSSAYYLDEKPPSYDEIIKSSGSQIG